MDKSEPLPKWMMRRYALLWKKFSDNPFTLQDCAKAIKEDEKTLLVLVSRLRKMGWLEAKADDDDARRRIYQLKPVIEVLERMNTE